ncbi:hypothetical protein [Nitrobacter winogradskyi]|uniref:hypothetical protein n=1 Tax=Nitrobacter winogradskyi TaxID=913 RepID=UPI00059E1105|nr:hypothetical protein [Nitrobacter winogradskyi]
MPKETEDAEANFTQRLLMSLVVDVTYLAENAERVKTQVFAAAKENGVYIPVDDEDDMAPQLAPNSPKRTRTKRAG